ncbi:protein phosphatase regulator [Lecanicillium sp. MT-2017a]|nr:protein phosphatase regulator [Lecanicillium sp. MT-2017a]
MADSEKDSLVSEFVGICGASPEDAVKYLEANGWDMVAASNSYFQDADEASEEAPAAQQAATTGPRTLDGRPAPAAATSSGSSSRPQQKKKGVATLGTLGGGSQHQHDDDDSGDDDHEDDGNRGNLFAGGEKSGLAVQDPTQDGGPRKIISDILAKAKANSGRPEAELEESAAEPSRFRGTGMTLGGEGVESRSIPDPNGPAPTNTEPQERILHIWQDGFSIDDGELRRFDDPANQMDLQMIRSGRAPLHLMNVSHDQPVDVKLEQHETPYKPQPKKYKPFSGQGQRLGSPVPGASGTATPTTTTAPAASNLSSSSTPAPTVDSSQPTIMIRIQLPDGTRLPARFNTTNTIGDVYGFVRGASAETSSRPWVLATTFPNKDHIDENLVLGEMSEFKKGGTAVVKWV